VVETESRRLGTTRTAIGADSIRGRAASPANTARTLALPGSSTAVVQWPATSQVAPATRLQAAPPASSSTSTGRPAADEPSANRSSPETADGLTPRTVFDVWSVSADTEVA
jgi:hypothetical protein